MKDFEDSLELFDNSFFSETQGIADTSSEVMPSQLLTPPSLAISPNSVTESQRFMPSFQPMTSLEQNWHSIGTDAAKLAQVLSLFADQAIPWELVDLVAHCLQQTDKQIDSARIALYNYQCFSFTDEGFCKLDALVRPFLQEKLAESSQAEIWKQAFARSVVAFVRRSTQSSSPDYHSITGAIPHLTEVVNNLIHYLSDEDSYLAFTTLGKFDAEHEAPGSAESWYERCVLTIRSRCPEQHPLVAASLNNLASFYQVQGNYSAAEPLFLQALAINQRSKDPLNLAISLNNLAGLYKTQGKYSEAEALYLQALAIKQAAIGEAHPSLATSLNNLASVYYAQERYDEAEAIYQRVLELKKCLLGKRHPSLATAWNNLASVYHAQKRYKEAEALYNRAVDLSSQTLGANHPNTMGIQRNIQKVRTSIANPPSVPAPPFQQFVHKLSISTLKLLNFRA